MTIDRELAEPTRVERRLRRANTISPMRDTDVEEERTTAQ